MILTVNLRPTELVINSTNTAEIFAEESHSLKVRYNDISNIDQKIGVSAGSVSVAVTPLTGVTIQPWVDNGDGSYNIDLLGETVGTYTITVSLSCPNFQIASVNFFLTVKSIPTSLTIIKIQGTNLTTSIARPINEAFDVTLNFSRAQIRNNPIDNAEIRFLGVNEWSISDQPGNGIYHVEIETGEILGIYPILVVASKENYEMGRASFELQVRPFKTELLLWGEDQAAATIPVNESLEIELYYNNTDWGVPISGADLVISGLPLTNNRTITWQQTTETTYQAVVGTGIQHETKPFVLTITTRHPPAYESASLAFELTIIPIPFRAQDPTTVLGAAPTLTPSFSVVQDQDANVTIQLWDTHKDVPIEKAEITWILYGLGTATQRMSKAATAMGGVMLKTTEVELERGEFEYIVNGVYRAFVPTDDLDPGDYRLKIIATKDLYGGQVYSFGFVVTLKPGTPTSYFLGLASIILGSIGGFYSWYFYFRWPPQVRHIRKAIKRIEVGNPVDEGRFLSKEEHRKAIIEQQSQLPRHLFDPE
jgi:hypothetical protein